MLENYEKFLLAKIYLIECLSLKGKMQGDETLSAIHDVCLMIDPHKVEKEIRDLHKDI